MYNRCLQLSQIMITIVILCVGLLPQMELVHATPFNKIKGTKEFERLGSSVASIPDISGDGIADFIIGSPDYKVNNDVVGKVSVRSGATGSILWEDVGTEVNGHLGYSVAGDATRIVVGSPNDFLACDCNGCSNAPLPGRVNVYAASATKSLLGSFTTVGNGNRTGSAVDMIGDLTGDGISEFIVGSPFMHRNSCNIKPKGQVNIVNGATFVNLASFAGTQPSKKLGESVSGLGDVNNDGDPDFATLDTSPGEPSSGSSDPVKLYVYSGKDYSTLHTRVVTIQSTVGRLGKLDSDNCDDFLLGEQALNKVTAISGACQNFADIGTRTVAAGAAGFGHSVDSLGDVNGDTVIDFIAGTEGVIAGSDFAEIVSGANFDALSNLTIGNGKEFGRAVAGFRADVTGDGIFDFIIGAPREDNSLTSDGSVYLYAGPTGDDCTDEDIFFQNQSFTSGTGLYQTSKSIFAGEAVTSGTNGPVVITANAVHTWNAAEQVVLSPGTEVTSGGQLSISVDSDYCQ